MICKIDALRGPGKDNNFIDKLLEIIERISMQFQRLKEIGEMKELEGEYVNAINELMHQRQKLRNGMMWCDMNSI